MLTLWRVLVLSVPLLLLPLFHDISYVSHVQWLKPGLLRMLVIMATSFQVILVIHPIKSTIKVFLVNDPIEHNVNGC